MHQQARDDSDPPRRADAMSFFLDRLQHVRHRLQHESIPATTVQIEPVLQQCAT